MDLRAWFRTAELPDQRRRQRWCRCHQRHVTSHVPRLSTEVAACVAVAPLAVAADADVRAVYRAYRGALVKRRELLDKLVVIPGPSKDVATVRREFLAPAYVELHQAEPVLDNLRQEAARNDSSVSKATDRRMLQLATLEEPVNDFLAARGLAACKTT